MKDLDDLELLQEFAKAGSEELFSKLVYRYAPLVYSVGLRVLDSPEAARDITQSVFIDLLHKLPRVITSLQSERSSEAARASLVGWLHRAARYEALELIRSEHRRQARERIAMQLQEQSFVNGSEWSSVRPVLDEALDSLDESDRRAVLLRYFQDASFRDVGSTFGISEDAAQKRISRALDRLRDILVRKGISTSAASLAAGLSSAAIESIPPDLANSISAAGLRAEAGIIPKVPSTPKPSFLPRFTLPLAVAFTALVAILWFVNPPLQSLQENAATPSVPGENSQQFPPSSNLAADTDLPSTTLTALEATMGLRVLSADTGLPLNDVLGVVNGTMDGIRASSIDVFRTDADGHARIAYTNNLFGMSIWLSHDGYASTLLSWKPGRGQAIPQDYTLRMASAPLIGGFVVDEHGVPLSDVLIQFNLPDKTDGPIGGRVESFHCQFKPEVFTDANGYFETKRIARDILPEIHIAPWTTNFLSHDWVAVSSVTNGVEHLLTRSFSLVLRQGLEVQGTLIDQYGSPAPGVRVTFGSFYSNQRSATTSELGEFVLNGCTAGTNIITAFDFDRGAGFRIINVSTNTETFVLRLEPFRTLHVQTVDSTGAPVPKVGVVWQSVDETGKTSNQFPGAPTPQYSFQGTTDNNGELIWTYAPADKVLVSFRPKNHGQRHNVELSTDAPVQIVALEENYPPQIIHGTVRDSLTGAPIPAIRVRRGHPRTQNGSITPVWYNGFRDIVDFAGGHFKFEFDYSVDDSPSRSEHIFEFSAEGYEPAISRVIRGDEGNLDLDVQLEPTSNPKDP